MTDHEIFALVDKAVRKEVEEFPIPQQLPQYTLQWARILRNIWWPGHGRSDKAQTNWTAAKTYAKEIFNAGMKSNSDALKDSCASYLGMSPSAFQKMIEWEEMDHVS